MNINRLRAFDYHFLFFICDTKPAIFNASLHLVNNFSNGKFSIQIFINYFSHVKNFSWNWGFCTSFSVSLHCINVRIYSLPFHANAAIIAIKVLLSTLHLISKGSQCSLKIGIFSDLSKIFSFLDDILKIIFFPQFNHQSVHHFPHSQIFTCLWLYIDIIIHIMISVCLFMMIWWHVAWEILPNDENEWWWIRKSSNIYVLKRFCD